VIGAELRVALVIVAVLVPTFGRSSLGFRHQACFGSVRTGFDSATLCIRVYHQANQNPASGKTSRTKLDRTRSLSKDKTTRGT
jgi:hypothetical protein